MIFKTFSGFIKKSILIPVNKIIFNLKIKIFHISDKKIIKNVKFKFKALNKKKQNYLQNKLLLKKIKGNIDIDNFAGLAADSRLIKKDNLFLTIKGKNNEGYKFIPEAIKKGAKYVVSSKVLKKFKKRTIKVKN